MKEEDYYLYTSWCSNIISSVASFWVATNILKLKEKTSGFKMILILSIIDIIFALNNIFRIIFSSYLIEDDLFPLTVGLARYCLYWTVAISIFTYKVIVQQKIFDANKFIKSALMVCFIASLLCPFM